MITTFVGKCSMNQVWAPVSWLQVLQSHIFLSQPTYHQGSEEGLHEEKGMEGNAEAKNQNRMKNFG
jgi:hypothetical protein